MKTENKNLFRGVAVIESTANNLASQGIGVAKYMPNNAEMFGLGIQLGLNTAACILRRIASEQPEAQTPPPTD